MDTLVNALVEEFSSQAVQPAANDSSLDFMAAGGTVAGLETLQTGKIIQARIPTVREDGTVEFYERKCLVLGLEGVAGKNEITGVYVVRLAFAQKKLYNDYGYVLDHFVQRLEGVVGLPKSTVIRTDRVDLIPANAFYLGPKLRTEGFVAKRAIMLEIADEIMKGLAADGAEASRGPRTRLEGSELRQTFQSGMEPIFTGLQLGKIIRRASLLKRVGQDDYERAIIQTEIQQIEEAARIGFEERRAKRVETAIEDTAKEKPARTPRLEYLRPADVRKGRKRDLSSSRIDAIVSRVNVQVRKNREAAGLEVARDPGHMNERAHDTLPAQGRKSKGVWEAHEVTSYFSVAENYIPALPPELKRNDIIVLKIADIMDPDDKRPAQRPCVVWNVYEDAETGAVCGLEVFPRTRLRAHQFDAAYTSSFPNLYRRNVWDGGYVLAQRIARVPVTQEYFHPVTKRVKPLNPILFDELVEKRAQCEADGRTIAPFGLNDIPQNWILREAQAPEITSAITSYAERILDERERQQASILKAPEVGDVILRQSMREGKTLVYPTLVWGVWNHKITGAPAAFDCVRIDWGARAKNAWSVELDIDPEIWNVLDRPADESWRADLSVIDLVPNTPRFFAEGDVAQVIGRVDAETLELMERRRADILFKNRKRGGQYPEFLRFDWTRVDGPSYGFNPTTLASTKFAPDLDYFSQQPGQLRHQNGRDKNRRGLPPRRKNEGFKKPKPKGF